MARSKIALLQLAAAFAALVLFSAPGEAGPIPLASYRAIYDLSLDDSKGDGSVDGLSGRLVSEFTGSRCAGYKSKLRFVTQMEDTDGKSQVTDSRSTSFETGDGGDFTFTSETYSNEDLIEQSEGKAKRAADGVTVALSKPGQKQFGLPGSTAFPTEQIVKIIAAAIKGDRFVSVDIYDGSENGETVYTTAAVIGSPSTAADDIGDETVVAEAGVAGIRHWPITVSYFDTKAGGEGMPSYVMSFVVYEDGIGRKLKIDYGDFAITGRLSGLEILPSDPCK
jgi:hypothetical protein